MKKNKFAGYINLKPLNGVIYPSSIQNILMKNYIENDLRGIFYLSPTEILQAKYSITLKTLISKETDVNGIVTLSSYYLPSDYTIRKNLFAKLIALKKNMHFILDGLKIYKKQDIEKVEDFLMFNCDYLNNTKKNLNKFEQSFMKKFKNISFV
tara:strand:+ start:1874 stop:2332 length:459 start_codon:yes stop_codon:yes gene_type:complete